MRLRGRINCERAQTLSVQQGGPVFYAQKAELRLQSKRNL